MMSVFLSVFILHLFAPVEVKAQYGVHDQRHIYDLWDSVVSRYIQPGVRESVSLNVVDYEGISKDKNYTAFIDAIANVNTSGYDHDSTYAFFINVYNALAIKMVIDHPCKTSLFSSCKPISSIKDIGSLLNPVWKMPAGVVAGKQWSLDDVENYLRNPHPLKEDSRLHASIVCASISCPNVRTEAFRPEKISDQMDDQIKDFLYNKKKGFDLDRNSNVLHLTPIFLWFYGDFDQYGGVKKFISPYISSSDSQYIADNNPSIKYFTYNWDINGDPPCHC